MKHCITSTCVFYKQNWSWFYSSVQSLSWVLLFATPWTTAHQASHPSSTPSACSNSCPSNWWCHPIISSSVIPFSHPQSLPASETFLMSHFFTSGGHNIGISASASVLPMNIQDWFPLGFTSWMSCSPRDSQESSPTSQFKTINYLAFSFLYSPTLTSIHGHWKNHSVD